MQNSRCEPFLRRRINKVVESRKSFQEQLLNVEQMNPSYKEKYEKEVRAMLEEKLSGFKKGAHIGSLILGLIFTITFGTLAVILPTEFPLWGRAIFVIGAIFGLAFVVLEGRILKKGSLNLKKDNMAIAGLVWCFIVMLATIILVFSGTLPDPILGVRMIVFVLVFLVSAAVILLRTVIERSELNTREKLLEIEYRIAEIAEGMALKDKR
jgi:hypothetical protein